MGFATEYSHFYLSFYCRNTLNSYAQINHCYPQPILSNEKRVGKTSFSFPTRCVNLIFTLLSYPHVYNSEDCFKSSVNSTISPCL